MNQMITNLPSHSDFESVALKSLTQSFTLLFDVFEEMNHAKEYEIIENEVSEEEVWRHHIGTLSTSLILLYQGIEGLLKSGICKVSPLLLIEKTPKEWPVFPNSENKDFDSLYTIGGESLLAAFCATNSNITIDQKFIDFIETIRLKRNKAMHGLNNSNVNAKFIVENILNTFTLWFGKDEWNKKLRLNIIDNPFFKYIEEEKVFEESITNKYLDFAKYILGIKGLSKFISVDITGREYFCPTCKRDIDGDFGSLDTKWGFLNPNSPESVNIYCINCLNNHDVKRIKCNDKKCKGNVVFYDRFYSGVYICLTCFKDQ